VERLWCGSIKRMRIGDSEFTPAKSLWSGGHQRRAVMGWRGEQGRRCQERECRARLSGEGRNRAAFGLQRKGKA